MDKVLVIGGTGLVGKHLCKKLQERGYKVSLLSRSKKRVNSTTIFYWNPNKGEIEKRSLESIDCIINLAGANISGKRWTTRRKKQILDSRVNSGSLIYNTIKEQNHNIKTYISASAIGYYGASTSQKIFSETDLPANDFLGEVCQKWEQATNKHIELGIRTVNIRTGIVLTKHGGALKKLAQPIKLNIGSVIGSGRQYIPWIHIDDLCEIYIKAITHKKIKGALNAVAPSHITNKDFTHLLANVLKKKILLPNIPSVIMKLIFGEMSKLILNGSRVSSNKIVALGYNFIFPQLGGALKEILIKKAHHKVV